MAIFLPCSAATVSSSRWASPCEDILGAAWLRVAAWLVSVASVVGNLAVVLVLLQSSRCPMAVSKFLMVNLAVADLCMGCYLFLIVGMDMTTIGVYFNYAIDWQNGNPARSMCAGELAWRDEIKRRAGSGTSDGPVLSTLDTQEDSRYSSEILNGHAARGANLCSAWLSNWARLNIALFLRVTALFRPGERSPSTLVKF